MFSRNVSRKDRLDFRIDDVEGREGMPGPAGRSDRLI